MTSLFHRGLGAYGELVAAFTSVSKDRKFIDKINGVQEVLVPKYQAKAIPEYDVFISHANKDKILNGIKKAEFAIIVISETFLVENGQKKT